jgi:hypothetical protein
MPSLSTPNAHAATAADGVIHWIGTGSQIYACERDLERFAWVLQGPDATLTDTTGQIQGTHGAGPSWTASDGSEVFGTIMTSIPAPAPSAVPWLVLRVSRHVGTGMLDSVGYVLRTDTEGGTAPPGRCDSSHLGSEQRVPYRANYTFIAARPQVSDAAKILP